MFTSGIPAAKYSIFPWPEFKFETVFAETFRIHIRAITNDEGLNYFKTHLLNINE
jgi:hypothetical protein